MKIEYDTPIEVSEQQYNFLIHEFRGVVAGHRSEGKYFIKVWYMRYAHLVETYLEPKETLTP